MLVEVARDPSLELPMRERNLPGQNKWFNRKKTYMDEGNTVRPRTRGRRERWNRCNERQLVDGDVLHGGAGLSDAFQLPSMSEG